MELVLEQQGSCRAECVGGLEGSGWSNRVRVERGCEGNHSEGLGWGPSSAESGLNLRLGQ